MPSYGEFVVKLRRGRDTMGIRMAIDRINANAVANKSNWIRVNT